MTKEEFKENGLWFIVVGIIVLWGIAILIFGASASTETVKYLIERKAVTSPVASISFSNIPYSETYELKGQYMLSADQPAMNNAYGLSIFFNEVASSAYGNSYISIGSSAVVQGRGVSNSCLIMGNGLSTKYVSTNLSIIGNQLKRYGNSTAGSGVSVIGQSHGSYKSVNPWFWNTACSYTDSLPITKIRIQESSWTYNFVASTTFELWGTKTVELGGSTGSSSSTTVNVSNDEGNVDNVLFQSIILFIVGFAFPIAYFGTKKR